MIKTVVGTILLFLFTSFYFWNPTPTAPIYNQENKVAEEWVDSVYSHLSASDRLAQLFVIETSSEEDNNKLAKFLNEYSVGIVTHANFEVREVENTDLDAFEAFSLPQIESELAKGKWPLQTPLSLAAIENDSISMNYGQSVGKWLKSKGVDFVTGVDGSLLNGSNQSLNHYFGEDKRNVYRTLKAFYQGLEKEGVLTVLGGFPGVSINSLAEQPSYNFLQSEPFFVYQSLLEDGIAALSLSNARVMALDSQQVMNQSEKAIQDLIRTKWHYQGFVIANDEPNQATKNQTYLNRLLAGADLLVVHQNPKNLIDFLEKSLEDSTLSTQLLEEKCKKVLRAKYWRNHYENPEKDEISFERIQREVIKNSAVLIQNNHEFLPIQRLDTTQIALVTIGESSADSSLLKSMRLYAPTAHFSVGAAATSYEQIELFKHLDSFNLLVISVQEVANGSATETYDLLRNLEKNYRTVLLWNTSTADLIPYSDASNHSSVLLAWGKDDLSKSIMGQLLFGGCVPTGKLPFTLSETWPNGLGASYREKIRLAYASPKAIQFDEKYIRRIDSIALRGIEEQAYPGCQIIVAKEGTVFYQKQFGHHTYEENQAVRENDIYDLASITKIASSMISVMHLQDLGKLNLEQTLGELIPEWVESTEYESIILRDMLAHQAGLKAWIPFYQKTLENGVPRFDIYSKAQNETYPYRVAEELFIDKNYPDSIVKTIVNTPLAEKGNYKYSDLGYYFIQKIVEKHSGKSLDRFVEDTFYEPMGLHRMGYKPREKFPLEEIVPTEYDVFFRKQLVHGDVHDPGAAMMGGVGGHAGLFSTANDLAKLMHMYMNFGYYGGERFLKAETVEEYTKCQFCSDPSSSNRRGAGFDKPVRDGGGGPTCDCVSYSSFGHTGFTGTIAWADPEEEIVFVFLSNRVYPNAANKKLIKMGIRTDIMQAIYDGINDY